MACVGLSSRPDAAGQTHNNSHSYKVPEVVACPIVGGSVGYLSWVTTRPGQPKRQDSYRRRLDIIWSRKAPVALWSLVVGSEAARVKSRCLAILVSVRTVTSIASPTSDLADRSPWSGLQE
jgi:hypothetical protein